MLLFVHFCIEMHSIGNQWRKNGAICCLLFQNNTDDDVFNQVVMKIESKREIGKNLENMLI